MAHREGITVVLATHDPRVWELADAVFELDNATLIRQR